MRLPEFSVNRPVTVVMMILIIVVLGGISLSRLPLDLMPDIIYPVISVVTTYEGVASEDIEKLVTKPIEEAVSTVNRVKKVSSISQEGISAVMVEFEWGTNLDFAAQDMRDKIDLVRDFLPSEVDRPLVVKFDPSMMPVVAYGVTGERDLRSLRTLTEEMIKDRLIQVDGVASAMLFGGREQEIQIEIDRDKLEARHLSLTQVVKILRSENINLSGGRITEGFREYLLRTEGEFVNLDEIREVVVAYANEAPVYLKDIATVSETHKEIRSYGRTDRKDSVIVIVNKQSGSNTVRVVGRVKREVEFLKRQLPPDIRLYNVFDQARLIRRVLIVTGTSGLWGGFLAILILLFFLRSLRPTTTVALAIPISVIATFIAIYFMGYTINMITLIGLALGVGLIVDNAIVVIENTYRHLGEGKDPKQAAETGASEVAKAITTSTLTTIAVFLPLVYASGIAGRLFRGLALVVTASLICSLFVALTLVPMMASKIFKPRKGSGKEPLANLRQRYKRILGRALQHRLFVISVAFLVFMVSVGLVFFMGREFMPKIDMNIVMLMARMPVGTSLEETNRVAEDIEERIYKEEGVDVVASFVGLSQATKQDAAFEMGAAGANEAELMIRLVDKLERKRVSSQIADSIRAKLPRIEGAKFEIIDVAGAMMTGGSRGSPIEVKIFGKDLTLLERIAEKVAGQIAQVEGVYDVDTSLRRGKPELRINIDRQKAYQLGLTVGVVASAVKTAFAGEVATQLRRGGEEIDMRVRFRQIDRQSVQDIERIVIPAPSGRQIQLGDIATVSREIGPVKLTRENQKREILVTANLSGRDLGSAIDDIKAKVARLSIPEGYFIEYGGEAERMQETFIALVGIFGLAILLVYMIMAASFESLSQPLVIMFTVPLALIGVIWALLITGKTICLPSGMGIIILSGIVVNNAIVYVDYVNRLRRRGLSLQEALIEAGGVRLRPILMTASTTILAMFPLAVNRAEGAASRSVVAISVIGGLLVSTVLTLIVIPIVYSVFDDVVQKVRAKQERGRYRIPSGS